MDYEQCTSCGATVDAGVKYCPNCGAAMSAAADDGFFEQSKHYFSEAADDLLEAGKDAVEAVKSPKGKKIASGAAIGALASIALPIMGVATGALAGAGIVAYRQSQKDKPAEAGPKPVASKAKPKSRAKTTGAAQKKK